MCVDGMERDVQRRGDFLIAVAQFDIAEYFAFAGGQARRRRGVGMRRRVEAF